MLKHCISGLPERPLPVYVVSRFLVLQKTHAVNQLRSPHGTRVVMYTEQTMSVIEKTFADTPF